MRVKKGTPIHGKDSLCLTCKNATVVQGMAESQQVVRCHELGIFVRWPVAECNEYILRGELTLHQMENMAHILEKDRLTGKYGFRPLTDKERGY